MEHNHAAIAAIINYLSDPREARTVKEIAEATAMSSEEVKNGLKSLKEARIVKSSGRGANPNWFILLDIELPVQLPEHLQGHADSPEHAESAADSTGVESADRDAPGPVEVEEGSHVPTEDEEGSTGRDEEPIEGKPDDSEDDEGTGARDTSDEIPEDAESGREESGGDQEWTVGGLLNPDGVSFGMIDLEVMSVYNLLPAHDADSGVDMAYLVRFLGAAMSTTRITKALWVMWTAGIAQARGLWRPDRGEWKLTSQTQLEDLKSVSMTKAPRRVTCPDCGHDAALNYKQSMAGTVRPFDPDAPAPEGFDDRPSQPGFGRCPEVMFCAMVLDQGDPMRAEDIAEFTGHQVPTVLQALWAMRACRIVECSAVQRPDGGVWRPTESTIERAHLVRLTDAPSALGCATCGQSIATRSGNPGAARAGGKADRGVPRDRTHDGGTPLPNGSLGRMIRAWAPVAPRLEADRPGQDPAVQTPTSLLRVLQDACESGAMFDWLASLAEQNPEEAQKISDITTAIATDARPRSSGAVKNALVELARTDGVPIERDWDARVETYRSTAEPDTESAPGGLDDGTDEEDLYGDVMKAVEQPAQAQAE